MAYEKNMVFVKPVGTHAANTDFTNSSSLEQWAVVKQCKVSRLQVTVHTAVAVGNTIISFQSYPVHGNSSGAVVLGNVTVTNSHVAGTVVYKDINPVMVKPGYMIVADVATASNTAGGGSCSFEVQEDPETAANNSQFAASV